MAMAAFITAFCIFLAAAGVQYSSGAVDTTHRPAYHFHPLQNWMNAHPSKANHKSQSRPNFEDQRRQNRPPKELCSNPRSRDSQGNQIEADHFSPIKYDFPPPIIFSEEAPPSPEGVKRAKSGHMYVALEIEEVRVFVKLEKGMWHAGPVFEGESMDFYNLELSNTNYTTHLTRTATD
ncbi:hypothetical protein LINPERPRIM_LOCUS6278 [Linum perenne]